MTLFACFAKSKFGRAGDVSGLASQLCARFPRWSFLQVGNNPNKAYTQDISLKIPKVPVIRSNSSGYNTAIDTQMGTVGMSVSNVALYGPAVSPTGGDAGISELDTFDCGEGHSTPSGHYHYHIAPYIVDRAQSSPAAQHSPLYGFLVDGFAVYGPMGDEGTTPTDLDACGGHSGDGGGLGYHYHTNAPDGVVPGPGDETVTKNVKPYFASCFRGCVPDGMGGAQSESYADCLAAAAPAPAGTAPSSASDLLTPLSPTAYNYTGCPAAFGVELQREEEQQNTVSAGLSASVSQLAILVAVVVAAAVESR
jgi:hypothetical protein